MASVAEYLFLQAVPVWKRGDKRVMNQTLEFSATVAGKEAATLCVAGNSSFLIFVNDTFVSYGPARAARGFYKVDEVALTPYLQEGENRVTVRVSGYNANSFSFLNEPSFLCAEIRRGETVIAATGRDFEARVYESRVQKVPRYSYQRTFMEVYRLPEERSEPVELEVTAPGTFIPRDVPYLEYGRLVPQTVFRTGAVSYSEKESYQNPRQIAFVDDHYKGFTLEEMEYPAHILYEQIDFAAGTAVTQSPGAVSLAADSYADLDMGKDYAGLFSFTVESEGEGTLFLAFDEIMNEQGGVDPFRVDTASILTCEVKKGCYRVITAEPYVLRFLRLVAKGTAVTVKDFMLREIAYPTAGIVSQTPSEEPALRRIYEAALLTFRTNVVDIYMDCASRERAGWLCDSFFIGRSERFFTGKSTVERAYLRNFLLPENFDNEDLPKGMFPSCYPADVMRSEFIPNWAMWYILHLYEYYQHTGDRTLVDEAKQRMYELLAYFRGLENEFGLLENLENWVFVEWSKANDLVQDVSFPSNMLYAAFKSVLGLLYGDEALLEEARALRRVIVEMSLTESGFFCDNAVRKDGKLVLTGERTEVCQYYAFWLKCASPESHPVLWETMLRAFGSCRKETGAYPEIYPANAFIGNYLRLDLLAQYGYKEQLKADIVGFFTEMVNRTGTLWEHMLPEASCSHGFASSVVYWMAQL